MREWLKYFKKTNVVHVCVRIEITLFHDADFFKSRNLSLIFWQVCAHTCRAIMCDIVKCRAMLCEDRVPFKVSLLYLAVPI